MRMRSRPRRRARSVASTAGSSARPRARARRPASTSPGPGRSRWPTSCGHRRRRARARGRDRRCVRAQDDVRGLVEGNGRDAVGDPRRGARRGREGRAARHVAGLDPGVVRGVGARRPGGPPGLALGREMEVVTFAAAGQPEGFHRAAAEVFRARGSRSPAWARISRSTRPGASRAGTSSRATATRSALPHGRRSGRRTFDSRHLLRRPLLADRRGAPAMSSSEGSLRPSSAATTTTAGITVVDPRARGRGVTSGGKGARGHPARRWAATTSSVFHG